MSAESDARRLANIRAWMKGRDLAPVASVRREDLDLLLRIADERDELARQLCAEVEK
uniref:hypothetical protein n=1 Tax=Microbacterium proteolyticum TaxID=1572644 RepID=UPI0024164AB4|nr:hypothetical protein [Microbacterium proteolyticum]